MRARNSLWLLAIVACSGKSQSLDSLPTGSPPAGGSATMQTAITADAAPAVDAAPVDPNLRTVTLADVGLDAASLDRTVDPCVDFYQFACGGWIAKNPIPADRSQWVRFSEVDQATDQFLQELIAADVATPADDNQKKIGAYFTGCTNTAAIDAAGLAPLAPTQKTIAGVKNAKTWLAAVVALQKLGIQVVWSSTANADFADARTNVLVLNPGALGLPDRDYFVSPDFEPQRAAYQAHLKRLFALVDPKHDDAAAQTAAADVFAIDTAIAKLTKTGTEARQVADQNHPFDLKALGKQVKSVDWKAYFKALGIAPGKKVLLATPVFFAALDKTRAQFTWAQWQHYFTYQLIAATHFALPAAIDDEMFALRRDLTGVTQQLPRAQRCTIGVGENLGDLLGQQYVAARFPASARQTASDQLAAVATAMDAMIRTEAWMAEPTRAIAQQKLAAAQRNVGYPEHWRTYAFDVKADDFGGTYLRAIAANTQWTLAHAGKPVDRGEWFFNPYTINAFFDAGYNATWVPAGILQPPFFGEQRSVAANLGAIGMIIGHEFTHGFDDQGAQFDAAGNLKMWWTPADDEHFKAAGTCVADQYSTFEVLPKQFVNGRLVLGETIADLGGVKAAFGAYRTLRAPAPQHDVADGFTEDQQFFLGAAQAWCGSDRPALAKQLLTTDPHAPAKFRIYGALRNFREFSSAFACAPGTPMNPANACTVW